LRGRLKILTLETVSTITVTEAQERLPELLARLSTEGEWIITGAHGPMARLSAVGPRESAASLRQLRPESVGSLLRPYPDVSDDLLGEMRAPEG
jgi:antitoxin (DNA-binding transcriptional repressor) of toxin-antitoxin stability system